MAASLDILVINAYISHRQVHFAYTFLNQIFLSAANTLGLLTLAAISPEFESAPRQKCKIVYFFFFPSFFSESLFHNISIVQAVRGIIVRKHCTY